MIPERRQQIRVWVKGHKKAVISGIGAVLVLGAVVSFANIRGSTQSIEETADMAGITAPDGTGAETVDGTGTGIDGSGQDEVNLDLPVLDEDQSAILDTIIKNLEEDNLQEAAAQLLDHEQKLQYVFYQVLEGKQYLYRDGTLTEDLEGKGLVMKKPLSVFYGSFRDGLPEGEGISIQGIYLDGMRYDYSEGIWKAGKMNGEGEIGYHYYRGIQGEENQALQKIGIFVDDLMEGSFSYRTTNSEGETSTWDMEAEGGRTKLDSRWIHEEGKQDYYLPSNENVSHTYVLPEAAVEEVRWRNMLLWEE